MILTTDNYKQALPERLHHLFIIMADRTYGREIHYTNQVLKFI